MLVRARTAWLLATCWLGAATAAVAQVPRNSSDSLSRAVADFTARLDSLESGACPTGPAVALPARGGAPHADSLVASLGELSRRLESLRTERCSPQPGVAQHAAPADTTDDLAALRAAAAEAAGGRRSRRRPFADGHHADAENGIRRPAA